MSSQAFGLGALGGQLQVVAVPATGDQQAEVARRTGDPVGRVLVAECPQDAGRGHQLEPQRRRRRGEATGLVAEFPGAYGESDEVAEPGGTLTGDAERIGDVLAVPEQLHPALCAYRACAGGVPSARQATICCRVRSCASRSAGIVRGGAGCRDRSATRDSGMTCPSPDRPARRYPVGEVAGCA
jgi:hypothetical protein